MLEELQRYINNKFCVLAAKVKAYVDAKVEGSGSDISQEDIDNWNSAYDATQDLETTYFPLEGGDITGVGGNGFVGLISQSSEPASPSAGAVRLFSGASGLSWKNSAGRTATIDLSSLTSGRLYILPDINNGTFVMDSGNQSIDGNKTFNGITSLASTTFTGNASPSTTDTRNLGTTALKWNNIFINNLNKGVATAVLRFGVTGTADFFAAFHATSNNLILQAAGAVGTDTNERLQVQGTTLLNGAVTIGGNSAPSANGTLDFGTTSLRWNQIWANAFINSASVYFGTTNTAGNIQFRFGAINAIVGGFHATTGNMFIQSAAAVPADGGQRLQVQGTSLLNGNITFGGNFVPDGDSTRIIGTTTLRVTMYTNGLHKGTASAAINIGVSGGSETFARFHPTTHNFVLQTAGAAPADSGERLQVQGNTLLNGGVKSKVNSSSAGTLAMDANSKIWVFTGTTSTWTLPVIAGNTGLELVIINKGSGAITLNANGGTSDIYDAGSNTASISIDAGTTQMIFHDGTKYATM